MIIYLLTFYLFDNIEKKLLVSLMRIILLLKGNFDKFWKMHMQAERLYFLFLFCARHYPWLSLWQKNTKNNLFIQVKLLFAVVEFSNTITFWRNARFNFILTSVTIIKLGFLRKLFCMYVCFLALRPKSTAMVIAGRSVHLTTLFPGQAWISG